MRLFSLHDSRPTSARNTPATRSTRDATELWLSGLHDGTAFGRAGIVLVSLAGLSPLVLTWSGLRMWLRRRGGRRRSAPAIAALIAVGVIPMTAPVTQGAATDTAVTDTAMTDAAATEAAAIDVRAVKTTSRLAAQARPALSGRAIDASGAALPGVTIIVSRIDSGVGGSLERWVTTTDADGRFELEALAAGEYAVEGRLAGFAPARLDRVDVPRRNGPIDVVLQPASLQDAVTVTATRASTPLSQIPVAVTVVTRETLARELSVSDNLTDVLAKAVPGLGPSRETEGLFGQSLRGRDMLVLVDGVPQNFELRIGATDELSRVSPSFVERVEVVRGASAAFGASAAGGIVNLITRTPDRAQIEASAGATVSATHADDSVDRRLTVGGGATRGRTSWFGAGAYAGLAGDFDADGDRIPQLFFDSETRLIDAMGRVSHEIVPGRRIDASGAFRHGRLRKAFAPDPGEVGVRKAGAIAVPLGFGAPTDAPLGPLGVPFKREGQAQIGFRDGDVFGSAVSVQAYALDYRRRNTFTDFFGGQLETDADKQGIRLGVEMPLRTPAPASLHWGVDAARYAHVEPMSGGQSGEQSGGQSGEQSCGQSDEQRGRHTFVPPITQTSVAGFAQLVVALGSRLTTRGGLRYEAFRVGIDDFVTHPVYGANHVTGGTLTYGAATGNAGLTWSVAREVDVYGGFSQGFSITEVGRLLRDTDLRSVEAAKPEAQRVHSLDAGVRARLRRASLAAAVYRNWSELGTTFSIQPGTGLPFIIRAPERIAGMEIAVDTPIAAAWRAGAQVSMQSGEYDPTNAGSDRPMPGFRIAPAMFGGYIGWMRAGWDAQVRLSWSGERDELPGSVEYGEGRVEPVTLVDLAVRRDVFGGHVSIGVANLFNRLYVPVPNQAFNAGYLYIAGRGTTVTAMYTFAIRPGEVANRSRGHPSKPLPCGWHPDGRRLPRGAARPPDSSGPDNSCGSASANGDVSPAP